MRKIAVFSCLLAGMAYGLRAQTVVTADICVYGASSAGVIAAYTAKKMGKSVLLVEPGIRIGGLTTGGLGYTDIGNKYAITGLSRDFYRRIGAHYGKFEQWIFEPGAALKVYQSYLNAAGIKVLYRRRLVAVHKDPGARIHSIVIENSEKPGSASFRTIQAKVFIDCSYEGDLMARAGVPYFTGREANQLYQESYNGVQLRNKHQFPDGIDPYRIAGDSSSGLLWGISGGPLEPVGSGDKNIQAYNFRICLTNEASNRIAITKPKGYDPNRYALLLRWLEKYPARDLSAFLKIDLMPNHKTDINNNGPFSTDMIGMNASYPEGDYAARKALQDAHEAYAKGFLYFIGHDARMPAHLRQMMLLWGYPKDEYTESNHWSPQMYVREARRMKGAYVMTQANCEGRETVSDGIGMAAYTMDSHNCQRLVVNGMVKNEGDVQVGGFGPYPVSYRSIIPEKEACRNLLVPVCLSATHIAYGSIRMEPVFMVLAQSAAMAAAAAIDEKKAVQDIDISRLQQAIAAHPLADNSTREILVDNDDSLQVQLQGSWKRETSGGYGPSLLLGSREAASIARFTPAVLTAGNYKVYAYFPKRQGMASRIPVVFANSRQRVDASVEGAAIRVEGQTSGEWVKLGSFYLEKGNSNYIEISGKDADGIVVADALLFVPAFGRN